MAPNATVKGKEDWASGSTLGPLYEPDDAKGDSEDDERKSGQRRAG